MNTHLLIIDPQNDFCDTLQGALAVPGAQQDMDRLATFMQAHSEQLDSITVTLDSHPSVAIERTTFWKSADGEAVQAFTMVSAADVRAGKFLPRSDKNVPSALHVLDAMAAKGLDGITVWPVHCVTGTWGHNIDEQVAVQLQGWELKHQRAVRKVLKGENPMTEHFGVFEAEVPLEADSKTRFNTTLTRSVTEGVDLLVIAGEASSHCVAASVDQLTRFLTEQMQQPRIVLLTDCMSPVAGFDEMEKKFFARAEAFGIKLLNTVDFSASLAA